MILPIKDTCFGGFIGQSYLKITLEPIRTQNLGSLLIILSQSNFNLRSPDSDLVRTYLIATVVLTSAVSNWDKLGWLISSKKIIRIESLLTYLL